MTPNTTIIKMTKVSTLITSYFRGKYNSRGTIVCIKITIRIHDLKALTNPLRFLLVILSQNNCDIIPE